MSDDPDYPVRDWLPVIHYGDREAEINFHIVTEIAFHPAELVTDIELREMTEKGTDYDLNELDEQIAVLEDVGLIARLDEGEWTFYGLTDAAKQFLVDDSLYRGSEVMEGVYDAVERSDAADAAYRRERPHHPPVHREYEERDTDTPAWEAARQQTYRRLTLSIDRVSDTRLEARFSENDDGTVLAEEVIESDRVDWGQTNDHREMEVSEPRGKSLPDDEYDIIVDDEGHDTIYVKAGKGGENWHDMIERCLYVFREPEHSERW